MQAIYPHLAARIFNTPLLIHPQKLDAMIAGIGQRLLGAPVINAHTPAQAFSTRPSAQQGRPYAVHEGVAVIDVAGALAHRSHIRADCTAFIGYDEITTRVEHAMQDTAVHAVLMAFDSPGGEVQGAFECAERLVALRGKKPLLAIADGMAASAAYLLASAADEVVVTHHVDTSNALAQDGIKVTHIFAGAHKVDGNPYEPLPEAVRADWQAEINGLYTEFVNAVAAYRGLSVDAVRNTQARLFRGNAAQAAGLANRIGTTDALIAELASRSNTSKTFLPPTTANAVNQTTMNTTVPKAAASLDAEAAALATRVLQAGSPSAPKASVSTEDAEADVLAAQVLQAYAISVSGVN